MSAIVPFRKRPLDWPIVAFFILNLAMITYWIDLEQLVIADPAKFSYPAWPLPFMVDMVHWWGSHFDPLQWARPVWWKATIWIDVLLFGPFYVAGIVGFVRGRDWIRSPSLVWSGIMFANVFIIMNEEYWGPHASPEALIVTLANAPWFLFPFYVAWRVGRKRSPFQAAGADAGREAA